MEEHYELLDALKILIDMRILGHLVIHLKWYLLIMPKH